MDLLTLIVISAIVSGAVITWQQKRKKSDPEPCEDPR